MALKKKEEVKKPAPKKESATDQPSVLGDRKPDEGNTVVSQKIL